MLLGRFTALAVTKRAVSSAHTRPLALGFAHSYSSLTRKRPTLPVCRPSARFVLSDSRHYRSPALFEQRANFDGRGAALNLRVSPSPSPSYRAHPSVLSRRSSRVLFSSARSAESTFAGRHGRSLCPHLWSMRIPFWRIPFWRVHIHEGSRRRSPVSAIVVRRVVTS